MESKLFVHINIYLNLTFIANQSAKWEFLSPRHVLNPPWLIFQKGCSFYYYINYLLILPKCFLSNPQT